MKFKTLLIILILNLCGLTLQSNMSLLIIKMNTVTDYQELIPNSVLRALLLWNRLPRFIKNYNLSIESKILLKKQRNFNHSNLICRGTLYDVYIHL